MSVLSNIEIISKIIEKEIIIEPFIYEHLQPSSLDLTLDNKIKKFKDKNKKFNINDENIKYNYEELTIDNYTLEPNNFILGQVQQTIGLSKKYMGNIQNRNSLIRLGINVGLSSYINPGYKGKLPIVIKNIGDISINLVAGMRICQLVIFNVNPEPSFDYSDKEDAKYHREEGHLISKIYEDTEFQEFAKKYGSSKDNIQLLTNFLDDRIKQKSKELFDTLSETQKKELGLIN